MKPRPCLQLWRGSGSSRLHAPAATTGADSSHRDDIDAGREYFNPVTNMLFFRLATPAACHQAA
ncbi:hypothetical protein [Luteimonas salinilitoris]|uniref:Uncharacterized protein n=1 Tax=Luteimonas salinilitoris TaxID=3237697 RepID=A0ABV4HP66_9GAMM